MHRAVKARTAAGARRRARRDARRRPRSQRCQLLHLGFQLQPLRLMRLRSSLSLHQMFSAWTTWMMSLPSLARILSGAKRWDGGACGVETKRVSTARRQGHFAVG